MINQANRNTAWLLFRPSPMWTQKFMKKRFGHIMIIYNDGHNWIIIDPRVNRLDIRILPYSISEDVPRLYMKIFPDWKILKVEYAESMKTFIMKPFAFVSCVSVIKYFLGFQSRCVTPWGLYKSLIKTSRKRNKKGLRKVVPYN